MSVCLSRTTGLSREHKGLGRLKLAQRQPTQHVTRTPLSRSKGQRSPGRFTRRRVGASGGCSSGCGTVFTMFTMRNRKCYFPSETDGHLERSWAIFRLYIVMMLSYLITHPNPCFAFGVPLRSSVVLASRL